MKKFLFNLTGSRRSPYDAIKDYGTRNRVERQVRSEDWMTRDFERDQLATEGANLYRNYSVAAWAIRKHLDYTTVFDFKGTTDDEAFNRTLEQFMEWWSERTNCDAHRKHPLRRLLRIAEQMRTIGGDCFLLKVGGQGAQRGSVQLIEQGRVRNPRGVQQSTDDGLPSQMGDAELAGINPRGWVNGIRLTRNGIAAQYALHSRTSNGSYQLERVVPAPNIVHHGYFWRPDMVRGTSPVNEAIASFKDLYETMTYMSSGVKAAAQIGLFIKREFAGNDIGAVNTMDADGDGLAESRPAIQWGPQPLTLYGRPGDEAQFLDSRKPSIEAQAYMDALIHVGIKCLDIPRSFWDASQSNYSSMRMDKIEFNRSIYPKMEDNRDVLNALTRWRVGMAVADGELPLPRGMSFDDVKWKWIPRGTPWVDPDKETRGLINAIDHNLDNPFRVAAQNGTDVEENIRAKVRMEVMEREAREAAGLTMPTPMEDEGEPIDA